MSNVTPHLKQGKYNKVKSGSACTPSGSACTPEPVNHMWNGKLLQGNRNPKENKLNHSKSKSELGVVVRHQ